MTADRIALLRKHGLLRLVVEAAIQYGITVDAVVQSLLGRGDAGTPASEAARELIRWMPSACTNLMLEADKWPYVCLFCQHDIETWTRCPYCLKVGCTDCVTGKGCPGCAAEQNRKMAIIRAEREAREALLKGDI